jgi:hypothetical protein
MNPNDYRMGSFTKERPTNTFKIRDSKGAIWHLKTTASKDLVRTSVNYLRAIGDSNIVRLIELLLWNEHSADATMHNQDVDFVL